jgi:hypothetical protein
MLSAAAPRLCGFVCFFLSLRFCSPVFGFVVVFRPVCLASVVVCYCLYM